MVDNPRYEGELSFAYEKGRLFRVIHVDGVLGGFSPGNGLLHMSLFNERTPIPQKVVHRITGGQLGLEIPEKREGKEGIFREVEADLVMSVEVAISLRAWLDARIEEFMSISAALRETVNVEEGQQ